MRGGKRHPPVDTEGLVLKAKVHGAKVPDHAEKVGDGRTFSWLCQSGRINKDYERLCASAEAFVYAAMIRLMVRRLARG